MGKSSITLLASLACFTAAWGADYYVTQSSDPGAPDSCSTCSASGNTCCTLSDALTLANSNSGSSIHIGVATLTYSGALSSPCTVGNTTTISSSVSGSVIDFSTFTSSCLTDFSSPTVFQPTGPLTLNNVSLKNSSTGSNVINIDGTVLTLTNTTGSGFTNNAWTLEGGTLYGGSNLTLPSTNSITVLSSGGAIAAGVGTALTIAGPLTGSGTLTIGSSSSSLAATGGVVLSGSGSTFTGPLIVSNTTEPTTLTMGSMSSLGSPSQITLNKTTLYVTGSFSTGSAPISLFNTIFSIVGGSTLTIPGSISPLTGSSYTGTITGSGTLLLSGDNSGYASNFSMGDFSSLSVAGPSNLGNSSSVLNIGLANFIVTGSGTFPQSFSIGNASSVINISSSQTATLTGLLSGSGTLNKSGAGTLVLSHTNTYSGGTKIAAGTLAISSASNIGGSSTALTLSGGTLHVTGNVTSSGTVTISASSTITTDASMTTTLSGVVTASSGSTLTLSGAGTVILSGSSNSFSTIDLETGALDIVSGSVGSATTINMTDATLNFSAAQTFASGNTLNLSGTNIIDDQGFNISIASKITGNAVYEKMGSGVQTLTNNNNSSNQYFLYEGTLSISNALQLGSSSEISFDGGTLFTTSSMTLPAATSITVLSSGGTLAAGVGTALTIAGPLEGSGTLTIGSSSSSLAATGGVVLSGSGSTFTGPLIVSNTTEPTTLTMGSMSSLGSPSQITLNKTTLFVTGSFSTGSAPISLFNTTFSIVGGSTLTIPGSISPLTGSSYTGTITGSGTLLLSGDNSGYASNFSMGDFSSLSVAGPSNLGSSSSVLNIGLANFIVTGSGTFPQSFSIGNASSVINISSSQIVTCSGLLSGIGALNKSGAGTLILTDTNTYSGGTKIAAGTLAISSASNIGGSATALTLSGGTLHATGNVTSSGAVTVSASSTITTDASMQTTLSGLMTGSNGATLTLSGSGTNSIAQVNVASSNIFTIAGVIGGSQTLTKTGTGTLIVTDACTYTGKTYVSGGTLEVDGSILSSGDPIILPGAILAGTGIVGDTIVQGVVKGGNPVGDLHIVGDLLFESGGSMATVATPETISLIGVTGAVTINPGAHFLLALTPGAYTEEPHLVLQAIGGITGHFSTTFSDYSFTHLSYTDRQVFFNLRTAIELASGGNAIQVANAVDVAIAHNRQVVLDALETGEVTLAELEAAFQIPRVIASLFAFSDGEGMTNALNQLHPAQFKGLAIAQENNAVRVRQSLSQRMANELNIEECFVSGKQNADEKTCCDKPAKKMFTSWIAGLGDTLVQDSVSNYWGPLAGYRVNTGGVITGFDVAFADYFYAGALGAYTHSHLHFQEGKGTGDISSGYAGVYFSTLGTGSIGKMFYANTALIGSWSSYSANRTIQYGKNFGKVNLVAKNTHGGNQILSHLDTGINIDSAGFIIRPFDSFDYISQTERGYQEHNAGQWELTIGKKNAIMIRNELGLEFSKCLCFCSSKWMFSPKISWVREVRIKGDTLNVRFTGASDTFFIEGYFPDRSLVAPGLAITGLMMQDALKFDLYYNGEFKGDYSSNSVGGQVSYSF